MEKPSQDQPSPPKSAWPPTDSLAITNGCCLKHGGDLLCSNSRLIHLAWEVNPRGHWLPRSKGIIKRQRTDSRIRGGRRGGRRAGRKRERPGEMAAGPDIRDGAHAVLNSSYCSNTSILHSVKSASYVKALRMRVNERVRIKGRGRVSVRIRAGWSRDAERTHRQFGAALAQKSRWP